MKKRILATLLAALMMVSLLPTTVFATEEQKGAFDAALPQAIVDEKTINDEFLKEYSLTNGCGVADLGSVDQGDSSAIMAAVENPNMYAYPECAYLFTATEEESKSYNYDYDIWYADYTVSFDQAVAKDSLGLYGSYGGYLNLGFLAPFEVPADSVMPLLASVAGSPWTYGAIKDLVSTFLCGAFNLSEENIGTTMTVQLCLFNPDPSEGFNMADSSTWTGTIYNPKTDETVPEQVNVIVIEEIEYTFEKVGTLVDRAANNDEFVCAGIAQKNNSIPKGSYKVSSGLTEVTTDNGDQVDQATAYFAKAVAKIGTTKYATLEEAFNAAQDGETVQLLANLEKTKTTFSKSGMTVTLDLNGYTVSGVAYNAGNGSYTVSIPITVKAGTLIIDDTKGNGKIVAKEDTTYGGNYALYLFGGNAVINNGTLESNKCAVLELGNSLLTVNGGKIVANGTDTQYVQAINNMSASLVINGGEIESNGKALFAQNDKAEVNGGYFKGTVECKTYKPLKGGYYTMDVSAFVADGYACVENTDENKDTYDYKVVPEVTYVAQITVDDETTKYATLAAAIAAVPTNGTETTITMIGDDTYADNANMTIAAGQNIVLDLNGKTVTGKNLNMSTWAFLTNNGTLEITDTSEGKAGKITSCTVPETDGFAGHYTVLNKNVMTLTAGMIEETSEKVGGGNNLKWALRNEASANQTVSLTINGGSVVGEYNAVSNYVYDNTSTCNVTVNGGYIATNGRFSPMTVQIASSTTPNTNVTITGGEFKVLNTRNTNANGNAIIYCDDQAHKVTDTGNLKFSVTGGKFDTVNTAMLVQFEDFQSNVVTPTGYVSGGYFHVAIPATEIAPGYECINTPETDPNHDAYPFMIGAKKVVVETPADVKVTDSSGTEITGQDKETVKEKVSQIVDEIAANTAATAEGSTNIVEVFAPTAGEAPKMAVEGTVAEFALKKNDGAELTKIEVTSEDTLQTVAEKAAKEVFQEETKPTLEDKDISQRINIKLTAVTTTKTEMQTQQTITENGVTFDVKPIATVTKGDESFEMIIPNELIKDHPITFRLPLDERFNKVEYVTVKHESDEESIYAVQGAENQRYVELSSDHFSIFTVKGASVNLDEYDFVKYELSAAPTISTPGTYRAVYQKKDESKELVYSDTKSVSFKDWYLRTSVQYWTKYVKGDKCDVRFVSMLGENLAQYRKAGFHVWIEGVEQADLETTVAYRSYKADGDEINISKYSNSKDYFFLMNTQFGKEVDKNKNITVQAYVELMDGSVLEGRKVSFKISQFTGIS